MRPTPRSADGLDYTAGLREVCRDFVARLEPLGFIDLDRVEFSLAQTRRGVSHGLQASLTPMRFEDGRLVTQEDGRDWTVQQLFDTDGRERLYILTVYMPRFANRPLREKLVTLLHELWHISPKFDGDLRRHEGRCYLHSSSQRHYDAQMERLADRWLALDPPAEVYAFLRYNFPQLRRKFGGVYGTRVPRPKLIPVDPPPGTASTPDLG